MRKRIMALAMVPLLIAICVTIGIGLRRANGTPVPGASPNGLPPAADALAPVPVTPTATRGTGPVAANKHDDREDEDDHAGKKDDRDEDDDDDRDVVHAAFTVTPARGDTTNRFVVDASGSTDEDGERDDLMYRWDWTADGTWDTDFSAAPVRDIQFPQPGTYTIRLQVREEDEAQAQCERVLTVSPHP